MRRGRHSGGAMLAALVCCCLLIALGCGNDQIHNEGVIGGGGRFQLVIEPGRTDVEATHFLADTATGDVWRLEAASGRWVRLASAPEDVRALDLWGILGEGPPETPE